MGFEQKLASAKDAQSEKPREMKQHTKDEVDKFNQMSETMNKHNLSEEKRKAIFEKQGMGDLYEKNLEKGKAHDEGKKAIERNKVLSSAKEQYKDLDNLAGVSLGTRAYEKKVQELLQNQDEQIAYYSTESQENGPQQYNPTMVEDLKKSKEDFRFDERLAANAEIMQTKKDMMEPGDFEKITNMDNRADQIKQERIANHKIIYDNGSEDMNAKTEATKNSIALEAEEEEIYVEKKNMMDTKYKGMGGI